MCNDCEWETALEHAEDLIVRAEDLPERAADFAESIQETLKGIAAWVEENEHVTDAQQTALDNIEGGVEKWER